MNVPNRLVGCLMSLLLLLALLSQPAGAAAPSSKAETLAAIDEYVTKQMKRNRINGVALAITSGDEVFYTQGYGTTTKGKAITGKTPFPIASLSKSMTALAVLQLAEQGRLDLDAPYLSYFPARTPIDPRVRQITVRHLLNQTSGLTDRVNPDMTRPVPIRSLQDLPASLEQITLASDPGAAYSYHNPNYQYLALLVEQLSGQRFSDYLQAHLFAPLGMSDTFAVSTTQQINDYPAVPRGHYLLLGNAVESAEPDWFVDGPAGVIATAEDMAIWMQAQQNGQLLAPGLMAQYHAPGPDGRYGMGWMVRKEESGKRTLSHSGILWTYKSEEQIDLDRQVGITVLFDTGLNAFVDTSSLVRGVEQIMQGGPAAGSLITNRNAETVMLLLIIGTVWWHKKRRRSWLLPALGVAVPVLLLLLLFLAPLLTIVGGGRVVPWQGIWMMMPSLIIWLAVIALANALQFVRKVVLKHGGRMEQVI
ncbi:CubicO group peptidase (beta-lactamase class C family) [Tumebacillus sp. BK434]|nr:CubicO group peptidase (beta-lactamase class C family) [Tumebacillus sp. BK434]